MHPKDVLIRKKAEEARARITERLHDMRMKDPGQIFCFMSFSSFKTNILERFAEIYSMLFANIEGQIEDEKKVFTEGAVPVLIPFPLTLYELAR